MEQSEQIPILTINAGPGDENWSERLKEEYRSLISYIKANKANDRQWFKVKGDKQGVK